MSTRSRLFHRLGRAVFIPHLDAANKGGLLLLEKKQQHEQHGESEQRVEVMTGGGEAPD